MVGTRFRNGKVNFFRTKVVREYDSKVMKIGDTVYDIFGISLGNITGFIDDGAYLSVKINYNTYDINEVYYK